MNKWNHQRTNEFRRFIYKYFIVNHQSPSVRDIATGTGIYKTTVQRYLTGLREQGEIEYNVHRSIGTNLSLNLFETTSPILYDSTVSCGLPSEPNVQETDIILLPIALVRESKFSIR